MRYLYRCILYESLSEKIFYTYKKIIHVDQIMLC